MCAASAIRNALFSRRPSRASYALTNTLTAIVAPITAQLTSEISGSAGGLIRWPARLLVPVGFFLLSAQGISELIKRIAFLRGLIPDPVEKHRDPGLDLTLDVEKAARK